MGKTYNYSFFSGLIPSDVTVNDIPSDTVTGGYFNSNGTPSKGYVWFRRNGNLTITGNLTVNNARKYVLLVNGGNLNINATINMNRKGDGFFMAIGSGDISFDPSLKGSGPAPAVEGLFLADGRIRTGAGTDQLYVRGSLAAQGGIVLERDLGVNNGLTPAELIEYAPDLVFSYPRNLTRTRVVWKEVAP